MSAARRRVDWTPYIVLVIGVLIVMATLLLTGCDDEQEYREGDCSDYEVRHQGDDCGYWDASGQFVLWYWVTPGTGGYRPQDWRPSYPSGARTVRPPNAKPNPPTLQKAPPNAPAVRNVPPPPARYNPPPPRYNPPPARAR